MHVGVGQETKMITEVDVIELNRDNGKDDDFVKRGQKFVESLLRK